MPSEPFRLTTQCGPPEDTHPTQRPAAWNRNSQECPFQTSGTPRTGRNSLKDRAECTPGCRSRNSWSEDLATRRQGSQQSLKGYCRSRTSPYGYVPEPRKRRQLQPARVHVQCRSLERIGSYRTSPRSNWSLGEGQAACPADRRQSCSQDRQQARLRRPPQPVPSTGMHPTFSFLLTAQLRVSLSGDRANGLD